MFEYPVTTDSPFTALGAHIYAGGFTLGMRTQFNVLAHFEEGAFGVKTVRCNMPEVPVHIGLPWPVAQYRGKVNVFYSNPPCAIWSPIGKSMFNKQNWRTDERMHCTVRCLQAGLDLNADVIVIETVPQLLTKGVEMARYEACSLVDEGYDVTFLCHDAKFEGMPQQRRRVFTIGSRYKLALQPPTGIRRTAADVFDYVEEVGHMAPVSDPAPCPFNDHRMRLITMVRNGKAATIQGAHRILEEEAGERLRGRPRIFDGFVDSSQPFGTIAGQGFVLGKWGEDITVSLRELAIASGYPIDYEFIGEPPEEKLNQVARAVTPPAAKYLARILRATLDNAEPVHIPGARIVKNWARNTRRSNYDFDGSIIPFDLTGATFEVGGQ